MPSFFYLKTGIQAFADSYCQQTDRYEEHYKEIIRQMRIGTSAKREHQNEIQAHQHPACNCGVKKLRESFHQVEQRDAGKIDEKEAFRKLKLKTVSNKDIQNPCDDINQGSDKRHDRVGSQKCQIYVKRKHK